MTAQWIFLKLNFPPHNPTCASIWFQCEIELSWEDQYQYHVSVLHRELRQDLVSIALREDFIDNQIGMNTKDRRHESDVILLNELSAKSRIREFFKVSLRTPKLCLYCLAWCDGASQVDGCCLVKVGHAKNANKRWQNCNHKFFSLNLQKYPIKESSSMYSCKS